MSHFVPGPSNDAFCQDIPCGAIAKRAATAALIAAIIGSGMAFIDGSAVNNALPILQEKLKATSGQAQWVIESYSLFLAALVLVGGALGDRLGRCQVYIVGVAGFALASIACALSVNIDMLIVARSIQGLAAAVLVPSSLALIGAAYDERERGRAIGVWSASATLMAAVGPILGGALTQWFSWRLVFFINVPLAVAAIVIAARLVPETRDESEAGQRVDWAGAALMTFAAGAIVFALIQAQSAGANYLWLVGVFVAGIVAAVAFAFVETRVPSPLMPPALFKIAAFVRINLQTLILYGALSGAMYFIPFELIDVKGYPPAVAGAALIPFVILMVLLSRWAGGLADRFGPRLPLTVGPALTAAGMFLLSLHYGTASYWTSIFPAIVLLGLGMTITVTPLTSVAMTSVPSEHVGLASGVNNAASRIAGLVAIAVFGVIMYQQFGQSLGARLATSGLSSGVAAAIERQRDRLSAIPVPRNASPADKARATDAIEGAFDDAFRRVMLVSAALVVLACLVGFSLPTHAAARARAQPAQVPAH